MERVQQDGSGLLARNRNTVLIAAILLSHATSHGKPESSARQDGTLTPNTCRLQIAKVSSLINQINAQRQLLA